MPDRIFVVAGARPNFMKIAPLMRELKQHKKCFRPYLIHTGQHYDPAMSDIFFRQLQIRPPDVHLNVGSASHAVQTARIMTAFEKILERGAPRLVIVVGDVNSTLACSLVAAKFGIKVAHVEAGLRSFDPGMPEEINRRITDHLSDYLFVTEPSGIKNLKHEGIADSKIFSVGNIMIDTLRSSMPRIEQSRILSRLAQKADIRLQPRHYAVLTLHRPVNVDRKKSLQDFYAILSDISARLPVIYPVHPRTAKSLCRHGFLKKFRSIPNLIMTPPVGYLDFIHLVKKARLVLTDSGGIQEETTVLKIPCVTMRTTTERPITVTQGTNYLTGTDKRLIQKTVCLILDNRAKKGRRPRLWDGRTAQRIVRILLKRQKTQKGI